MVTPTRTPTLPPEEWDFSKVHDDDLETAIWWEYLRAIPKIKQAVRIYKHFKKNHLPATERRLLAMSIVDRLPVPFWREKEWPRHPFLLLPYEKCRALRAWRDKHEAAYELEYDSDELESSIRSRVRDLLRTVPLSGVDHGVECANWEQWVPRRLFAEEPPIDLCIALLRIDWDKSDNQLIKMFKNWLELRRPPGVKAIETKGGASAAKKRRALLRELGAYRLLKCMSWAEAVAHTKARLRKPLFSGHYWHPWQVAETAAETQMDSLLARLTIEPWFPIDAFLIRRELGGVI
jgi:hypothetical protein